MTKEKLSVFLAYMYYIVPKKLFEAGISRAFDFVFRDSEFLSQVLDHIIPLHVARIGVHMKLSCYLFIVSFVDVIQGKDFTFKWSHICK